MNAGRKQFRRGQDKRTHPRALALVASMWIILALTGLVLSMAYSVRLEALASANRSAAAQAEAAARGAEQYLLAAVDQELYDFGAMKDLTFEARQIGNCYVWFINSVPGSNTFSFDPIDEGGKFNLNLISFTTFTGARDPRRMFYYMLTALPGVTDEQANSIIDWRDSDGTTYGSNGAESSYYTGLNPPYRAKNGDLESIEELLLVKGFDVSTLYGSDTNRNGTIDGNETAGNDATHGLGLAPYITTYGVATQNAQQQGQASSTTFKINLNTASVEVLTALFSYNGDSQTAESVAKDVVSHRQNTTTSDPTEIVRWLQSSKGELYSQIQNYVNSSRINTTTPPSVTYSADILAVTRDGRAFKRYRVVAQGSTIQNNVTKIILRQDITTTGWPLDPKIREDLRNGIEPTITGVRSFNK